MSELLNIPGLVEIHTHLREPWIGAIPPETMASGTRAALYGGYVAVGDMPNNLGRKTLSVATYQEKASIAERGVYTRVMAHAGYEPEESEPAEFASLMLRTNTAKWYMGDTTNSAGVRLPQEFDQAAKIMARVNPKATVLLHAHPETLDETLYMTIQKYGLNTHVCHVKAENLPIIEDWRQKNGNVRLTSGVTPHHILLNQHDELRMGWPVRMMPGLERDVDAVRLLYGLKTAEIDCVETDHAPHLPDKKMTAELQNPNGEAGEDCVTCYGVPSSEFAFPIMRNLVRKGLISQERLVEAFTTVPASIMGVRIDQGTTASFTDEVYQISERDIKSQCGQTPYLGTMAVGRLVDVKIQGRSRFTEHGNPIPLKNMPLLQRDVVI